MTDPLTLYAPVSLGERHGIILGCSELSDRGIGVFVKWADGSETTEHIESLEFE